MPLLTCFGEFYAPATDAILTCANLDTTLNSLQNMAGDVCSNPRYEYFASHASTTITIAAADLPTANPERIRVYVNGNREFDSALIAGGGYTVDSVSQITLGYDPTTSTILVEYDILD